MTKTLDDFIKDSIQEKIDSDFNDILDDFINSDPDWFENNMSEIVSKAVVKLIEDKSKKVIENIVKEYVLDYLRSSEAIDNALRSVIKQKMTNVEIDFNIRRLK